MKCVNFLTLILHLRYTSSQYVTLNHKQAKTPCESSTKNSLIEHFFNIIFSEFHTTPPVCVCVQMCAGQSTYCYPNGCLKRDDLMRVDSPQATPQARPDRKQYMFVVDEKTDFMKEFFDKAYVDELKMAVPTPAAIHDMRPDLFKDKYNTLVKYKKTPNVELRYNLREQVKNMKSDLLKIETVDLSKTRWPMNKRNLVSGHKVSKSEKKTPLVGKANVFMSMAPTNDYADYPPKYFKRDIAKSLDGENASAKAFYLLENSENATYNAISIETLIDNLIKNSFKIKPDEVKNNIDNENKTTQNVIDAPNKTSIDKEAVNVLSMNITEEKVDNNKYTGSSINFSHDMITETISMPNHHEYTNVGTSRPNELNKMIVNLSKRIEKQNNTSMEIAKQFGGEFDAKVPDIKTKSLKDESFFSSVVHTIITGNKPETDKQETTSTTSANYKETMMTKKNRQRIIRKLQNGKSN